MKKSLIYFAFFFGAIAMLCFASSAFISDNNSIAEASNFTELLVVAKTASSRYINNTCDNETHIASLNNTVILVERAGRYHSFTYYNGIVEAGEVYYAVPSSIQGLHLETNLSKLRNIPDNIYIFVPKH